MRNAGLPATPLPRERLLEALRAYRVRDVPWREGHVLAGLYDPGADTEAAIKAAYTEFLSENALYVNYYPSVLQLEREVVRMVAGLLRADDEVVGNFTSGGTESILVAMKAARDWARATRPRFASPSVVPEIVLPRTAHPAFHKAAHYLGMRVRVVEFDPVTFRAVPAQMEAAIGPDTIAMVVSAPNYSHGVVDPVPAVATLAAQRGLWCHVDACVGGLHLSVMRTLGLPVPEFDWTVPGVSSISVDLHKYGYAAKNASVVMFRHRDLRRFAVFVCADTTGYAVLNTTVASSRTAGPLAAAWAALRVLALPGYQAIVREVQDATRRLVDGVSRIEGLRVLAAPDMCMFSVAADPAAGDPPVNVFALEDEMARRGWYLQAQFSCGASPANLHFSVSRSNVPHVDRLLADLAEAVIVVRHAFGAEARATVERLTREATAALSAPGPEAFAKLAALAGLTGDALPEGFATVNTVLDALPDAAVDALLAEYLNQLYV